MTETGVEQAEARHRLWDAATAERLIMDDEKRESRGGDLPLRKEIDGPGLIR